MAQLSAAQWLMSESPCALLRDPSLRAPTWRWVAGSKGGGGKEGGCSSDSLGQGTLAEFDLRWPIKRSLLQEAASQAVVDLTYVNWVDCFYSSHAPQQQSHRCRLSPEDASVVAGGDIRGVRSLRLLPRLWKLFAPGLTVISPLVLRWCSVISVIKPRLSATSCQDRPSMQMGRQMILDIKLSVVGSRTPFPTAAPISPHRGLHPQQLEEVADEFPRKEVFVTHHHRAVCFQAGCRTLGGLDPTGPAWSVHSNFNSVQFNLFI